MKKNKLALVLVISIFLISLVIGIIYGINNKYDVSEYINTLDKDLLLFDNLMVILLFFFSTISLLGVIINGLYISFSGVSVGYIIASFFNTYGISGIFYSLINILINKLFFLLIIIYLFIVTVKYTKKCFNNIVGLSTDYLISLIKPLIKKYLVIISFLVVYDILNYFFAYKVLKYFTFILN